MRDIPVAGRPVLIDFVRQRMSCAACGNVWQASHPSLDPHRDMTARFVRWLGSAAASTDFDNLGAEAGIDRKIIQRIASEKNTTVKPDIGRLSDRVAVELLKVAGRWRPVICDLSVGAIHDILETPDAARPLTLELADRIRDRGVGLLVIDAHIALGKDSIIPRPLLSASTVQVSLTSLQRDIRRMIDDAMRIPIGASARHDLELFRSRRSEYPAKLFDGFFREHPPAIRTAHDAKEALLQIGEASGQDRDRHIRDWFARVFAVGGNEGLPLVARRIRASWPEAFDEEGKPAFSVHIASIPCRIGQQSESFAAVRAALIARDNSKFAQTVD